MRAPDLESISDKDGDPVCVLVLLVSRRGLLYWSQQCNRQKISAG